MKIIEKQDIISSEKEERKEIWKNPTHLVLSTLLFCSSPSLHTHPSSSATAIVTVTQQRRKNVAIVRQEDGFVSLPGWLTSRWRISPTKTRVKVNPVFIYAPCWKVNAPSVARFEVPSIAISDQQFSPVCELSRALGAPFRCGD